MTVCRGVSLDVSQTFQTDENPTDPFIVGLVGLSAVCTVLGGRGWEGGAGLGGAE